MAKAQDTLNKLTIALPLGRIILNRDNIGLEPITHRFYLIFAACVFNVSYLTRQPTNKRDGSGEVICVI